MDDATTASDGARASSSAYLKADTVCACRNKVASQKCASCLIAAYCDKACQKNDWKYHKQVCSDYRSLPPRPSASHHLIALFPSTSTKPRLCWVVKTLSSVACEEDGNKCTVSSASITQSPRTGEASYLIVYHFNDSALGDGSKHNTSIRAALNGKMPHDIRGWIIADAWEQSGLDATPWVYRFALDYFRSEASGQERKVPCFKDETNDPLVNKLKFA